MDYGVKRGARAGAAAGRRDPARGAAGSTRRSTCSTGFRDSREQLIELRALEDEGDTLLRNAIAELFRSGQDAISIIRWKDIHERLEEAVRRARERRGRARGDPRQEPCERRSCSSSTVVVALGFDFTNGFHDTANAVATSVSTRALSPRLAVAIASVANLAGAFVTTAVAKTVGQGIIDTGLANEKTVLAALIGAIVWNLLTWRRGLPRARRTP